MVFHGVIKMSLFLCAGAFMHKTGHSYIYEVNGIGRKMPVTFTCYTLGALSLTGIPLFCGFISKWQLLRGGAGDGTALGVIGCVALIISAFLCAMYTLTISVRAFFAGTERNPYAQCERDEASLLMLVPIVLFTVINVLFGVWPGGIMSLIEKIAGGVL
jgi:multicomponent Na+:H+ antiporter subunit D